MESYEAGRISRRNLLLSLGAMSAAAMLPNGAMAQDLKAPVQTVALNSVGLLCSDPRRSIEFYQRLFGLPVQASSPNGATCLRLGTGPQFLMIMKAENTKPRIDHLCMTVKSFDPARTLKALKDSGVASAMVKMRTEKEGGGGPGAPQGTPELFFTDPDGLNIQLQHVSYAGGGGIHGERTMTVRSPAAKPPLDVRMFNHCTIQVDDIQRTVDFYQKHFGMFLQVKNTLVNAPDLGIGPDGPLPGHSCIGITHRPNAKPEINHVCFGMPNFDHEKVLKTLNELGLKSGEGAQGPMTSRLAFLRSLKDGGPALGGPPGGTPEIFFNDPDGILIQLQDVSFCGEANAGKDGTCPN